MRRYLTIALLGLASPLAAQRSPVDNMQWLAGCWERSRGQSRTIERWTAPSGGEMIGESYSNASGEERTSERLRLFAVGDTLVYAATPTGQRMTEFRSPTSTGDEITFANPAHDFPQRIIYRRVPPDSLIARIEGDRNNRIQPVTFSFRKIECPPRVEGPTALARKALQPKYDDMAAREMSYVGGINGWFAANAGTTFRHVMWTVASEFVPVATAATLARADSNLRANPNRAFTDRRFTVTLDQVLARGDTADVHVTMRYIYNFTDTPGRYGTAGAVVERDGKQRRLDSWVREGGEWRLRSVNIVGDEIMVGGKLIVRDGRPVP